MGLTIVPCTISDAKVFVAQHHRHHNAPDSALFACAVATETDVVGVAIVGRPKARGLQDGFTAEVVRLATTGEKNACSMLYAACWRAARALGYRRLVTYILSSEPGTSLVASGWTNVGECGGGSWSCESRPRIDTHPMQTKIRFEVCA